MIEQAEESLSQESHQQILGKNVRELRGRRGMTQEALALGAGVAAGTLGQLERGEVVPLRDTLQKVINALGIEPQDPLFDQLWDTKVRARREQRAQVATVKRTRRTSGSNRG